MDRDRRALLWEQSAPVSLQRATEAWEQFSGQAIQMQDAETRIVPWKTLKAKLDTVMSDPITVAHLKAMGLVSVHVVIAMPLEISQWVVQTVSGDDTLDPSEPLGSSVLGELINVMGTALLGVFSETFQVIWEPLPPRVWTTTTKAILGEFVIGDSILLTDATVVLPGKRVVKLAVFSSFRA